MPAAQAPIDWYVLRERETHGPFTEMELARLARERHLTRYDFIWCAGMPDWVAAASVPGLLPQAVAPAHPFSFSDVIADADDISVEGQRDATVVGEMASDWDGSTDPVDAHEPPPAEASTPEASRYVYEHVPVAPRVSGFAEWLARSIERAPAGGIRPFTHAADHAPSRSSIETQAPTAPWTVGGQAVGSSEPSPEPRATSDDWMAAMESALAAASAELAKAADGNDT